jgi:hypothetical protein
MPVGSSVRSTLRVTAFSSRGASQGVDLAGPLGKADLGALWAKLADTDAANANQAICILADKPAETVPFVRGRLRPTAAPDAAKTERLVADLGSDRFEVRRDADKALAALAEQADIFLRRGLANKPPLETQRRIERLLAKRIEPITDPIRLRDLRAIEVLEQIGTPAARQALEPLISGDPEARLTKRPEIPWGDWSNGRSPSLKARVAG